jgi:hypothetical protein
MIKERVLKVRGHAGQATEEEEQQRTKIGLCVVSHFLSHFEKTKMTFLLSQIPDFSETPSYPKIL